jgi:3-oxoadipate CoA-transferase, beta subunit
MVAATACEYPIMSERAKGLSRQEMCDRLAMEFGDGWIVNLGIGIPTLCSNFDFGDKEIIFHSENGVIGYGPLAAPGKEDLHLVNAGGQHVTLRPGAAIVHHADSFALIRSGKIDVTVLGAYEVAENGDFANWKISASQQGGGIGGAMDLAACAKHVFVAMEHQTRNGGPRLVERCSIPVTAKGVVNFVVTNYGLFEITKAGTTLKEIAAGVTVDEIKAATGCNLIVPPEVPPVRMRR